CYGMFANELPIPDYHATKILGPRPIQRGVDHNMTDLLRPKLLWLGRKTHECIDFPVREHSHSYDWRNRGPLYIAFSGLNHMYRHACKKEVSARPEEANGDVLPLKLSNRADAFVPEKLITAGVNSGQEYDWVSRINLSQDGPDICYVDVNFTGAPSLSCLGS